MIWDHAMYALGVASLTAIFAIALRIFRDDLVRHWPRIIRTLRGNDVPGFVPLSPTASVLPLRTSHPQLRAVEADAQPTLFEHVA
jgi:hypothetical protein